MSTNPPRVTVTHGSFTHSNHPTTTTTTSSPTVRSSIDDYHDSSEVTVRKYALLPDIPTSTTHETSSLQTAPFYPKPKGRKQVFNHFAHSQRQQMPTVNRISDRSVINALDLDEDFPQGHCESSHRAATYTSPGERIISPIKRPSAPSPPTSAQIKRANADGLLNDDDYDDDEDDARYSRLDYEDSQIFNEHFYHYPPAIIMGNRHHQHPRHAQILQRHPAIIINDGYDELNSPLDCNEFEP